MLVDLNAPYQTYADKLAAADGAVSFSTGGQPWGYAAAVGLGLGGDVKAPSVDVALITAVEPVYIFMVDSSYQPVGDRQVVTPKDTTQTISVPLAATAYSLIIQSGERPGSAPVKLVSADLRLA